MPQRRAAAPAGRVHRGFGAPLGNPAAATARAVPNALSLGCLGLGFLAALEAGTARDASALRLLALAALADALAGRAAQGLRQNTPLGAELDSLAGLVVWGVATALLAYSLVLAPWGGWGLLVAGTIALTAAWRLCRGDLQNNRAWYEGLPLGASGMVLVSGCALGLPFPSLAVLVLLFSVLQLSKLRYPRFRTHWAWLVPVFLSTVLAALGWVWGWVLPGATALGYALFAPWFASAPAKA